MTEVDGRDDPQSGDQVRSGLFASFSRPGFRPLYLAGFLFGTSRWGLGFLAAFVANDLTSSPRAVQLTGAAMWAPMLAAGVIGGVLADRWDRRRILLGVIGILVPIVGAIAALSLSGALQTWMLYPFMFSVGLSWVADMTSRRTLVLDVVGVDLIDNAMALESLSTSLALGSGVLAGGAVVDALGVGQAFAALAGLLLVAGALIAWSGRRAPAAAPPLAPDGDAVQTVDDVARATAGDGGRRPPAAAQGGAGRGVRDLVTSVREGLGLAAANPRLRAGLGVTVVANAFFFSHTPLIPVFADQLGAGPLGAGLLASAGGLGMMLASLAVAHFEPPRGPTYVFGASLALTTLIGLGVFTSFLPVYVSLLVASTGFGLFGATQSVVIMTSVGEEHRGRAMGLLSMAIGVLPAGMYSLGELAEAVGARSAVVAYAAMGLLALGAWVGRRREVLAAR